MVVQIIGLFESRVDCSAVLIFLRIMFGLLRSFVEGICFITFLA